MSITRCLFSLLCVLALAPLGSPARAQMLEWEHVGSSPRNAAQPSIGPDGTLWAGGFIAFFKLPPPYGPTEAWVEVNGGQVANADVLALGQDTLVASTNQFYRSTDNGVTFQHIPSASYVEQMLEIPQGLPFAGTLVGENYGRFVAYSRDRGASWQRASVSGTGANDSPAADDLAIVRHGPHAGRIVGGGLWGLATSDDGGATFTPVTGLWQYFRFDATAVGVLESAAPDGSDRLVASVVDPTRPGRVCFIFVSDDGGDSWRETFTITGDPNGAAYEVVDFGGGHAVLVMNGGHVWQTTDAGETWAVVGIVPGSLVDPGADLALNPRVSWGMRGPDGRLYVGGWRLGGANPGWAFRTVDPFAVAGEAAPEASARVGVSVRPNPAGGRVEVVLNVAEAGAARVVVVDALGREVAVVLNGAVSSGECVVSVETGTWPAGVYVVHASVGGQTASATPRRDAVAYFGCMDHESTATCTALSGTDHRGAPERVVGPVGGCRRGAPRGRLGRGDGGGVRRARPARGGRGRGRDRSEQHVRGGATRRVAVAGDLPRARGALGHGRVGLGRGGASDGRPVISHQAVGCSRAEGKPRRREWLAAVY